MTKWRIKYERVYLRPEGKWSAHKAWSVYYGTKLVARYTKWPIAVQHVTVAHERFGL